MKKLLLIVLLAALFLLTMSPSAILAKSDKPGQVNATGIEIVKKVTLKGPAAKGGKPSPFAAAGAFGTSCTGNKYAIVIGINDYPSSDLQYAVADADEMKNVLSGPKYGFQATNIILLTNAEATETAIKEAISNVKSSVTPNDEVVFFFSGHGARGKADDGDRNNVDQSIVVNNEDGSWGYIWDGELKTLFNNFPTNRIVFIFDSCLSGGMSVLNGNGRVVNMACTATGLSYEGASWGGGHGQFTYYFAEAGIQDGAADVRSHDGSITVEEAFDYAKANCRYQTPTIADSFPNDLLP